MAMETVFTDGLDERFTALCLELDGYLDDRVGGETQRKHYAQYNTTEKIADVVLLLEDGQAVACGGIKPYGEGAAEIKRVFTKPAYRGRGYARAVMAALEDRALSKGYTRLILETGRMLEPAVRLYTQIGYQVIENYGQYCCMPDSVCMEKILVPRPE
jgi:putative acetyltransferase